MSYAYVVEAETNGAGSGVLPAIGGLAPPSPPTLSYFKSQDARFTRLQFVPIGHGHNGLLTSNNTDVVLLYSDVAATIKPGHVPGMSINVAAGIANGQYLNRSAFKAA